MEQDETIAPGSSGLGELGDYRLIRVLGEGAMGRVYEAVQLSLERRIALKVLSPELQDDEEFLARFRREARSAAAISHHNVVAIFDIGEAEGLHFFAMELVAGESLGERLRREGKLEERAALKIVREVTKGLAAAADQDIVHRDIKPDNILCGPDGSIKIADLGLARSMSRASELTMTGAGLGTPNYMSPEQASGNSTIDHRTDIYSLGITLFHLLTGEVPFKRSTPMAVAMAHVNDDLPSGEQLGTPLAANVEKMIRRMTAKIPRQRFPDYASLIASLNELLGDASAAGDTIVKPELYGRSRDQGSSPHAATDETVASGSDDLPAPGRFPWFVVAGLIAGVAVLVVNQYSANENQSSPSNGRANVSPESPPPSPLPRGAEVVLNQAPFASGLIFPAVGQPHIYPIPGTPPATIQEAPEGKGTSKIERFDEILTYAKQSPTNYRTIMAYWNGLWKSTEDSNLRAAIEEEADRTAKSLVATQDAAIGRFRELMYAELRRENYNSAYAVWYQYPTALRTPAADAKIYHLITNHIPLSFRSVETGMSSPVAMPRTMPAYIKNSVEPPPPAKE